MAPWRPRRRYRGRDRFDTPPDPNERFGDDPCDADPFDEDDDPDDFDASPSFVRRPAPPGRLTWRQHFAIVETTMRSARPPVAAWDPSREIVYVVDIPRSSAGAGLLVEFLTRERGQERAPRGTHLRVDDIPELPDAEDRRALTLFAAMADAAAPWRRYDGIEHRVPQRANVTPIENVLLPGLLATGRCLARTSDGALVPIVWDGEQPWRFVTVVRRAIPSPGYLVKGVFRRGGETTETPILMTAQGFLFWPGRAGRLADASVFAWAAHLLHHGPLAVPAAQGRMLLEKIVSLPGGLDVELPQELAYETVRVAPQRRLRLREAPREWGVNRVLAEVTFDYGGTVVAASTPGRGMLKDAPLRLIARDAAIERDALAALAALGFRPRQYYGKGYTREQGFDVAAKKVPRAVAALLAKGWFVQADGKVYRPVGAFRIEVTSGVDWFDLEGGVRFGDVEIALPALLAAARRGESTVTLGDGTFGLLPEEWLRRHGLLASLGTPHGDVLRFERRQVGVLDALLSALPEATCDAVFGRAREALASFDGVHPRDASPDFAGRLREYQREGVGWLEFLRRFGFGGCLADDMGLGKTIQVLAALDARREERANAEAQGLPTSIRPISLVVVPRSLVFNWKEEAERFTPKLRIRDCTGQDRPRSADGFEGYDVVLTTYGTLRRDVTRLTETTFDYVVLDEAQAIKNAQTDAAKAARLLRADHRVALSGTPVQNHVGELWSLFEFLNPGMLGSAAAFGVAGAARWLDETTRTLLARAIRPFVLRRTKAQVAPELPPRIEQTLVCELPGEQRARYDELREHYRRALLARVQRDGVKLAAIHVLEALLRLRQAACHLGLVDRSRTAESSAKLDVLLSRLAEVAAEGHQALVFSQFTSFLRIVRARLDGAGIAYEYLDGKTRDRAAPVERFQGDRRRTVFLMSLTAGGLGLNLTSAEYVFLLDPWWNPAVEAQAIDRTHRIGQARTVFAYRVIARDTVEDKILELQQTKRDLAAGLITGDNSLIRSLTTEDLAQLLS